VDPATIRWMQEQSAGLMRRDLKISKYLEVRGVEFQEEFLVVTESYWEKIESAISGDSRESEMYSCLHTLLTRPKDAISIFIVSGQN